MKLLALLAAIAMPAAACLADSPEAATAQAPAAVQTAGQTDSISRAAATIMAQAVSSSIDNLTQLGVEIDRNVFVSTLTAALNGQSTGFTREEADAYVNSFVNSSAQDVPDTVSIESQQGFIAQQAALPGAETTASGLVFIILQEGEGAMPTDSDIVNVQYTGRLSDGTIFDQTGDENVQFNVNQLIPGFTEALKMMRPGGTYRVVIPYNLAYGEKGIQGIIPGYSALDFTVTLEGIVPPQK